MRLVLFAFPVAIGVGYLLGGRLGNLGAIHFRHGWAGLAGVGLQLLPVSGTLGQAVLLASFALLVLVTAANLRLAGFALVLVGLCANLLVIALNGGMPVTRQAIVASGQAATLEGLRDGGGAKHHLAGNGDVLLILADRFAIPAPVRQAVSLGDLAAYGGAMWFVAAGMRRRREDPTGAIPAAEVST